MKDYIQHGSPVGSVANRLLENNMNPAALRPWIGNDDRHYITRNEGGKTISVPTMNATATLRKDDWIMLDEAILRVARQRLRVVADLRAAGLTFNIPDGMGVTVLQTERQSDITGATTSMDPVRKGERDRPHYDIQNLPLPVIHKDFSFSARQIQASRRGGSPLDTSMAEMAGRKVAEEAERLVLGTASDFRYGGGEIYGFTNFPDRITKDDITAGDASGWTGATLVNEILAMRQASYDANYFGPFSLYVAPAWDQYLDDDYSSSKGDNTVRDRIMAINGIENIRTADFLGSGWDIILVQNSTDVVREVIGMDITTVQWDTEGGLEQNFKVMAILVPQLRADFNGNTGIVHGTTS